MTDSDPSDQEGPGTTTRRQFVGAAAVLAASPHIDPAKDFVDIPEGEPLGFPAESNKNAAKRIELTQSTYINFPQGKVSISDTNTGPASVFARTDPKTGKVKIHTMAKDEERNEKADTHIHFDPEAAEFFAMVLLELAQKARDKTEWRYP